MISPSVAPDANAPAGAKRPRPRAGIFGLAGCAGDQLALLNCEDQLLRIVELLDVRDFLMASSDGDTESRLDVALVEGAVVSERDAERLRAIRARSDRLVALGTCALHGGIPVMDRDHDRDALLRTLYGELGSSYDTSSARALHEVVEVDAGIPGCPVEAHELLDALASLLRGDPPLAREFPVCTECKMRETHCLLTDPDAVCLGPVTAAGCDARCPALGIGCIGCRGPSVDANWPAAIELLTERGVPREQAVRKLRTFARPPAGLTVVPAGISDPESRP